MVEMICGLPSIFEVYAFRWRVVNYLYRELLHQIYKNTYDLSFLYGADGYNEKCSP